jgi:hypothetical protein
VEFGRLQLPVRELLVEATLYYDRQTSRSDERNANERNGPNSNGSWGGISTST